MKKSVFLALSLVMFLGLATICRAQVLFSDDFNDGDCKGWTEVEWPGRGPNVGEPVVEDGELVERGNGNPEFCYYKEQEFGDCIYTVDVKALSTDAEPKLWDAGVAWHIKDNENCYIFRPNLQDPAFLGSILTDAEYSEYCREFQEFEYDVWYTIKIVCKGNHYEIYFKGGAWPEETLITEFDDNHHPKGKIGFLYDHEVHYDNVMVTTLKGAAVNPSGNLAASWGRLKAEY